MSWQLAALNLYLRRVEKPLLARAPNPTVARERLENLALLFPMPPHVQYRPFLPDKNGEDLRLVCDEKKGIILWFHGGAYVIGSPRTHRAMVAALAQRAGTGAVLPDYRRAPEHAFPAAVADCIAAWDALLDEGYPPHRIILGGDSAGGGLAFALIHKLLSEKRDLPAGVVGFSPWVDLSLTGDSLFELSAKDVILPIERIPEIRDMYLQGANPRDPMASPFYGCFAGAPPALIQASDMEILLDDARQMARRLSDAGVDVTLDVEEGVPHNWQSYQGWLPEADASLDAAAAWIARLLDQVRT
jgi:epsilon-lactone hydrolase